MRFKGLFYILVFTLVLAFSLLASGCSDAGVNDDPNASEQPQIEQEFKNISASKAYEMIQEYAGNEDFIIVDVRSPSEYSSGHIEGAVNINCSDVDFDSQLAEMDKEKAYLIYCASGNRSGRVYDDMRNMGFLTVYNMKDGINEWKDKDYPLVS